MTHPSRSATEQLLISAAIDRAANQLAANLAIDGTLYLDAVNFDGTDGQQAVGAIREAMLRRGARVVDTRDRADYILQVRTGALSIDAESVLVGLPSINIPFAMGLATPEIALFSEKLNQGVVKLAGVAYDPESGELVAASGARYGFSHQAEWTALLIVSWSTSDLGADDLRPTPLPWH